MITSRLARKCFVGSHHVRRLASAAPHTHVEKIVRDSIKAAGPISVAQYMQLCLAHPTHGYYKNPANPVFGTAGDFITSPEISQVFGELIAIWLLSRWLTASSPPRIRVIELGPGRGTLAADALRTWTQFPAAREALKNGGSLHLVETSDSMRELQKETLQRTGVLGRLESAKRDFDFVQWHASLEDVRDSEPPVDKHTFTMIVAHEFFDALPVHVLEKTQSGWHEVQIAASHDPTSKTILTPSTSSSLPKPPLRLVRNPEPSTLSTFLGKLSRRYAALPIGSRLEVSPTSFKLARMIAEIVNDPRGAGGAALVMDYGRDSISGNSLRAFKKHKIVDIFETPGECDLTANVDFALLKEAIGKSATTHGPITQRDFLTKMGIETRLAALASAKADSDTAGKEAIAQAAHRLVDPTGMGVQYKVLAVTGSGTRGEVEDDVWPFEVPHTKVSVTRVANTN